MHDTKQRPPVAVMDYLQHFAEWAWARHHNPLSWYIRPVLLIPYCYFAWRRNLPGMALSLLALFTSMFWFPAPAEPDPLAKAFLEAELRYLKEPWSAVKIAFAASVPLFLAVTGLAFWHRSVLIGLAAINLASLLKIAWSFHYGGSTGWTVVAPALIGLLVVNAAVLIWSRRNRTI